LPALSGFESGAEAMRRDWRTMLGWVVVVNAASAVVILIFGEAAVHAVAGRQWLPAVPIMRILAVAMLFRAILVLTGQLLDAVGQPAQTMRLNALRLGILVVVLAPLAAWGGLRGVALAVLVANAAAALRATRLSARALSS
jgi:O-antigen/teichoic acid export membrane protein